MFINPAVDDPKEYITFYDEVPVAIDNNDRGVITINKLGLNREKLNDQRRKTIAMIKDLYDIARDIPETSASLKERAKSCVSKYYQEGLLDETEYAGMIRAFFNANPVDAL